MKRLPATAGPVLAAAIAAIPAWAQNASPAAPPVPPTNLLATDHPFDGGEWINVTWSLSADDRELTEAALAFLDRSGRLPDRSV